MSTRVSIAGHPIHPMLVSIPIGLWIFSFVADLAFLGTADSRWETVAYFTLAGAIVGALVAAIPGFIDFLGLQDPRARHIAVAHMSLNLVLVAVAALDLWLRSQSSYTALPYVLSGLIVLGLLFSGWLGGQLVHVLGVTQPGAQEAAAQPDRLHPRT